MGAIGDADPQGAADFAAAEREVGHPVFEEDRVWDHRFLVVGAADHRRAGVHFDDDAADAIDIDHVADPDLALGEHDDAADEILDQGLHPEADPDGEGAAEEREDGDGDAEEREGADGKQQADDDHQPVAQHPGLGFRDVAAGDERGLDAVGDLAGDPVADDEEQQRPQQHAEGDGNLAGERLAIDFHLVFVAGDFEAPDFADGGPGLRRETRNPLEKPSLFGFGEYSLTQRRTSFRCADTAW